MSDPYSPGELGRAVERIELDIREIKTDLKSQGTAFITRGEFEAWRTGIDREVRDMKQSIADGLADIKADLKHSTPQWWVIAALGVAALSFITTLVGLAIGG